MNTLTAVALLGTLGVGAADWFAVHTERLKLEYLAKPLTMVVLIGACLAVDTTDTTAQKWFVAALVLSMAGDIFLMLPQDLFIPGLASFLVGHLAYIAGLWSQGTTNGGLAVGALIVAIALPTLGRKVFAAVRASDEPELLIPVTVYILVISAMVVSAAGVGEPIALLGALLFYVSDATIAWTRFIENFAHGRVVVMVTYHLAQIGLVLSLAA